MNLHDFLKLVRARWITICVTTSATLFIAVGYTLIQTPLYEASTRLFVSTAAGSTMSDLYSGNRLSQDRTVSYTQLITGVTLAQRTIDRLALQMSAEDLKAQITAKSKPGTVLIDVSVRDASPVRARDIANALSDEFVVMIRELETPSPGAQPDARVVVEQMASVPEKPVLPKRKLNIAIGFAIGALLGIGLAFIRDLLDSTVKSREALEELTGMGVVGITPADKALRLNPIIPFETGNSESAESFRKLRTNLQFLSVDDPARLIVVTSATPNEGKSTTAINIALVLAEAGNTVLLVDGDMRRPSLSRYLNLVGSVGFSTALSGRASLDEVLQETHTANLRVLAAGPSPPNPSELLGTLTAKKALDELRNRFDYVIVDSPPLLAVTDGAILAAQADGTILLTRAGVTKRDQVTHAIGILRDVGATVLGAMLTIVPIRRSGPYDYDHYYGATEQVDHPAVEKLGTPDKNHTIYLHHRSTDSPSPTPDGSPHG